jgi:hypothetical protein
MGIILMEKDNKSNQRYVAVKKENVPNKPTTIVYVDRIDNPSNVKKETVLYWYGLMLQQAGFSSGSAARLAERVYFLPDVDAKIPIKEGPTPADWDGYHAGKHGLYDRFNNLKGQGVKMSELFYNDKYRWINQMYKDQNGKLALFTEDEINALLNRAYEDAPKKTQNLSGLFDSEKFTKDVSHIYKQYATNPKTTVWEGRFINKYGKIDNLQINVDFMAKGNKCRIAIDAKTSRILNFFTIDETKPIGQRMKYVEIVGKWKGKMTDLSVHEHPSCTAVYMESATWRGLFLQGVKSGALVGAIISAFFGMISGFKQEGLVGAIKGLSMGIIVGGAIGGLTGGIIAIAYRLSPILGKIVAGVFYVLGIVAIVLTPSEIGLDPQEWKEEKKDKDGNKWKFRHFHNDEPCGIRIECTDGTIVEMGEERVNESSYGQTVLNTFAESSMMVKWISIFTPEGSRMWWWQVLDSQVEHVVIYRDKKSEDNALKRINEERSYRF